MPAGQPITSYIHLFHLPLRSQMRKQRAVDDPHVRNLFFVAKRTLKTKYICRTTASDIPKKQV